MSNVPHANHLYYSVIAFKSKKTKLKVAGNKRTNKQDRTSNLKTTTTTTQTRRKQAFQVIRKIKRDMLHVSK